MGCLCFVKVNAWLGMHALMKTVKLANIYHYKLK